MSNMYKIENLENLLECSICLDRFRDPKVLSCQHSFCLACLKRTFNAQRRTLDCPTCRKVIKLAQGPDELPNNLLLISLMDVRPVKAQCPCCNKIEALTICEHCQSTKCSNCNEKHTKDIRDATQAALDQLKSANQADLQTSIHDAFKHIRQELCNQFQSIRHQQDAILLTKQMDILKQLDGHQQTLLTHLQKDLQPLEQSKTELTEKSYHLDSKNEPELIDLANRLATVYSSLTKKFAEHQAYIDSIEISLQYDKDHIGQIHQMCNNIQLNIFHTGKSKPNEQARFSMPSQANEITLRTCLNQEYKYSISLDKTVYELKEAFGRQERVDPNRITLTRAGDFFDQLDDSRTLRSYNCDANTILMISIRK